LAKELKSESSGSDNADLERVKQRLDLLDDRLDNIDSVVSAVAERIMKQPISIILKCPHCNKNIEISMVGQQKPT
jgi:tetrahydromethanopterin S-methyltransferase subunit G